MHISYNEANSTLGFLHRNLKSCPPHIQSSCYKLLVVPIIEYGSTVWDPHLHKDINKIEKIQRHRARFVKWWYTSVTSLINDLQWQSLQSRRTTLKVTMLYKIIHNFCIHPQSLSHPLRTIRIWNKLDYKSVNKSSLQQFKTVLHNHVLKLYSQNHTPHLICTRTYHALIVICVVPEQV